MSEKSSLTQPCCWCWLESSATSSWKQISDYFHQVNGFLWILNFVRLSHCLWGFERYHCFLRVFGIKNWWDNCVVFYSMMFDNNFFDTIVNNILDWEYQIGKSYEITKNRKSSFWATQSADFAMQLQPHLPQRTNSKEVALNCISGLNKLPQKVQKAKGT